VPRQPGALPVRLRRGDRGGAARPACH
jgi:hypothetical protein